MSEIRVNNITNRDGSTGTTVAGIPVVDSTSHFVVPSGDTAERGSRGRGLFTGGAEPARVNTIQYITIATTGNSSDFGDLINASGNLDSLSSSTRGITAGGLTPSPALTYFNTMDYVTISSTGNAFDFGDLVKYQRATLTGFSNSTRGIFAAGQYITPSVVYVNTMEYITIATLGNASNFGDTTVAAGTRGSCSSPTRGVIAGGYVGPNRTNVIDYVTFASTGDALDFGDLTLEASNMCGCSSSIRGIFHPGQTPTILNTIEFITIASLGNATDFGDLTEARTNANSCSSLARGVFAGGTNPTPSVVNTIDYITIATTGDAVDYGDLDNVRQTFGACSDSHGGLG